MTTKYITKLKPQYAAKATLASITLDQSELVYTSDTKELKIGDGATVGGHFVKVHKSNILDLNLVASEIQITPDIAEYGTSKTVHNALDNLATNFSVGGTLGGFADAAETSTAIWSGSYIRSQLNTIAAEIATAIHAPVQDITALRAIDTTNLGDKVLILVEDSGQFRFDLQSTATDDGTNIIQPTTGSGRWIRFTNTNVHAAASLTTDDSSILSLNTSTQAFTFSSSNLAKLDAVSNDFTGNLSAVDGNFSGKVTAGADGVAGSSDYLRASQFNDGSLDLDVNSIAVNGSDINSSYLAIDGSNANQNIDIGANGFSAGSLSVGNDLSVGNTIFVDNNSVGNKAFFGDVDLNDRATIYFNSGENRSAFYHYNGSGFGETWIGHPTDVRYSLKVDGNTGDVRIGGEVTTVGSGSFGEGIEATTNASDGGFIKMTSAAGSYMIPFFLGKSESTAFGQYFLSTPTSPTQNGFTDGAFYYNARSDAGDLLTTGSLAEYANDGVTKFKIDITGDAQASSFSTPTGSSTTLATMDGGFVDYSDGSLDLDVNSIDVGGTGANLLLDDGTLKLITDFALQTDISNFITENQTITLTGDATGSGKTNIAVTVVDDSHAHTAATITLASINLTDTADLLRTANIGASVQAYSAELAAIAAIAETSGLLRKTAANTWELDTNTYLTQITKSQVEAVLTGDISSHTHSQYLTSITKSMIEAELTGVITTHTHNYNDLIIECTGDERT